MAHLSGSSEAVPRRACLVPFCTLPPFRFMVKISSERDEIKYPSLSVFAAHNSSLGAHCLNAQCWTTDRQECLSYFARCFFKRALKAVSPPLSPLRLLVVIAGVEGELVRGVTASPPMFCCDLSAAILFALTRRPRRAGVFSISARF